MDSRHAQLTLSHCSNRVLCIPLQVSCSGNGKPFQTASMPPLFNSISFVSQLIAFTSSSLPLSATTLRDQYQSQLFPRLRHGIPWAEMRRRTQHKHSLSESCRDKSSSVSRFFRLSATSTTNALNNNTSTSKMPIFFFILLTS